MDLPAVPPRLRQHAASGTTTKRHLPVEPEHVERGVVQVTATGHQVPKALAALGVQRNHLTVENGFDAAQLSPHVVRQLREAPKYVAPLGPEVRIVPGEIEQPSKAVVLGLEQIGGILEGLRIEDLGRSA